MCSRLRAEIQLDFLRAGRLFSGADAMDGCSPGAWRNLLGLKHSLSLSALPPRQQMDLKAVASSAYILVANSLCSVSSMLSFKVRWFRSMFQQLVHHLAFFVSTGCMLASTCNNTASGKQSIDISLLFAASAADSLIGNGNGNGRGAVVSLLDRRGGMVYPVTAAVVSGWLITARRAASC